MSTQSHHEAVKDFIDLVKSDFPEVRKYTNWLMLGVVVIMVVVLYIVPFIGKLRNSMHK